MGSVELLREGDIIYVSKGKYGYVSMSPRAFKLFLESSGSKAKSDSGQRKAVKKFVIEAIKYGLKRYTKKLTPNK